MDVIVLSKMLTFSKDTIYEPTKQDLLRLLQDCNTHGKHPPALGFVAWMLGVSVAEIERMISEMEGIEIRESRVYLDE